MNDTPKTEAVLATRKYPHLLSAEERVLADFARELERENADLNAKLDTLLTDVDYEGGIQYWIQKHDASMLRELRLVEENAALRADKERLCKVLIDASRVIRGLVPMGLDEFASEESRAEWAESHAAAIDAARAAQPEKP